jgi:hypothetical protein
MIQFDDASWRLNFQAEGGFDCVCTSCADGGYCGQTYGIALADVDGDGWLDLFANHHLVGPSELLYGFGRGSVPVTPVTLSLNGPNQGGDEHGAVFFDIDRDGDLDLLESVGGNRGTESDPTRTDTWNKVLLNRDGQISTVNSAADFGLEYGPARGRIMVPIELDGETGMFLGSAARDDGSWPAVTLLQRADGSFGPWTEDRARSGDTFAIGARLDSDSRTDIVFANSVSLKIVERGANGTREAPVSAGSFVQIRELLVADFDGDLEAELFVGQIGTRLDKLLDRTASGTWIDVAQQSGLHGVTTRIASAVSGDFDNDGDQDIVVLQDLDGLDLVLWINDGTGVFSAERIRDAGIPGAGQSIVSGDVNNDGSLDLVLSTGIEPPNAENAGSYFLLEGRPNGNNWLSIALKGTVSETDGLGARVYLRTPDGREQVLEQDSGAHRWAQDDTRLHFGLGAHDSAEVRVVWADGYSQSFGIRSANQRLTLVEDRSDTGPVDPPVDPDFAGLLTIERVGDLVTVTATSQSGKAFLEGGIRTGGFETSALTRQNFEAVDSAELVPGGVDFDLAVFAGTGLFDRFSFRVDAAADLTVSGDFDVLLV